MDADNATQNRFVPNSFQVVNAYVDDAMQYLSGDEFKVLIYTVRHIMGWQDRVALRRAHISLTTYVKGYGTMGGVGLSREKVLNALRELETYGFIKRVKSPDTGYHKGTLWELNLNPNLSALKTRASQQLDANRKRIDKARKARGHNAIGLTVKTGLDTQTDIGLTDKTDIGLTDKTESNALPNALSNSSFAPANADATRTTDTKPVKVKKERKPRQRDLLFDAIAKHLYGIPEGTRITSGARIGLTKTAFIDHDVSADDVPVFWAWMRRAHPKIEFLKDPAKVEEYLVQWLAQRKGTQSSGGWYPPEFTGKRQ